MASVVEICNRALQKLGARRISSLSEDSVNGRACNACYEVLRDAELQAHKWNFAIERVELAADSPAPTWGKANSFTLPSDFLKLADPDPEWNENTIDYQIEGTKIFTNYDAPLQLRYVKKVTDANTMPALFREALSSRMAMELAEELTQSNSKRATAEIDYKRAISEARKANAIARRPADPATDSWITRRD